MKIGSKSPSPTAPQVETVSQPPASSSTASRSLAASSFTPTRCTNETALERACGPSRYPWMNVVYVSCLSVMYQVLKIVVLQCSSIRSYACASRLRSRVRLPLVCDAKYLTSWCSRPSPTVPAPLYVHCSFVTRLVLNIMIQCPSIKEASRRRRPNTRKASIEGRHHRGKYQFPKNSPGIAPSLGTSAPSVSTTSPSRSSRRGFPMFSGSSRILGCSQTPA